MIALFCSGCSTCHLQDCGGKCYDQATSISDINIGVSFQIEQENSKVLCRRCYGNTLSLVV